MFKFKFLLKFKKKIIYLIDEDNCDQCCKVFFGESCDVTHKSACINCHHEYENNCYPRTDPKPKRHVVQFSDQTKFVDDCLKHKHRTCAPQNGQG